VNTKPSINDALWMAAGAAALFVVIVVVRQFHATGSPVEQFAFKARRVDQVERMRLSLASASEAEKSSVLAVTDGESQTFADQARAATADVEQDRAELGSLLEKGGTREEKEQLSEFSKEFAEFQAIDRELLALAVKNTNLKAYALAFGPAAQAISEMDAALDRVAAKSTAAPGIRLAFRARIAALRIQALLAPHIAEETDQKMDELESRMQQDDQEVRRDLDALAALPESGGDADCKAAASSYSRFSELRTQILALSRENTNVRSLSISLDRKRKVMLLCQAALDALQKTILAEPIAGVDDGPRSNPRRLGD
jgi:leucyl-tRNA synthetase